MPTTKKRLNISLPDHLAVFVQKISLRDDVPQATKIVQLLEHTLEMVEDEYFSELAKQRDAKGTTFVSHEEFWKKAL